MNKLYDKILLVVAVLALIGGCAVYFLSAAPRTPTIQGPGDRPYVGVEAPVAEQTSIEWGEAEAQPSGFTYDVFTPYEIYLDRDGNFTQQGPNISVTGITFGSPYLVSIERELYRIQLEGYIEEDPKDPSKVLLLFLDVETGMSVRGRVGQEKAEAGFRVTDFKIVREDEGGAIIKVATATIRDTRTGEEIILTDARRRLSDTITVTLACAEDPNLVFEFNEIGVEFETATGKYLLEEINLVESSVSVKKFGDDVHDPIIKQLFVESPDSNPQTPSIAPAADDSAQGATFDAFFQ